MTNNQPQTYFPNDEGNAKLKATLKRRGVEFDLEKFRGKTVEVADASKLLTVGLDTLGKLDYLSRTHRIYLPVQRHRKDLGPIH